MAHLCRAARILAPRTTRGRAAALLALCRPGLLTLSSTSVGILSVLPPLNSFQQIFNL